MELPKQLNWNGNELVCEKGVSQAGIVPQQEDVFAEVIAHRYNYHEKLVECLKWYVENDDTNIGQEGNEFWEDGLNKANALLEEIFHESPTILTSKE